MEGLYYASELFKNEGDGGIAGAKTAMHAVARYIAVRHERPELAAPILAIHQGFSDLENGVLPDLFSNDPVPKERSRARQHKHAQLTASVLMEALMQLGSTQQQAAARVARKASSWPGMSARKLTATTIRNWRDKHRSKDEGSQFQLMLREILRSDDPRALTDRFLEEGPLGIPAT
jgi:hypothetical protein